MKRNTYVTLGASTLAVLAAAALGASPATASPDPDRVDRNVTLSAELHELNSSGVTGSAFAVVKNKKIKHIEVHASGLTPDAPHAQHIHYGEQATNECPTLALDANGDGRLNTVEGIPAYGPVVVSLTTAGDTGPGSFLDVTRFPVLADGEYSYSRDNIKITEVAGTGYPGPEGTGTAAQIAEAIRDGEGVVVIHGLDYDGDGEYSLSDEGLSELPGGLPAEATDPAACGVLR